MRVQQAHAGAQSLGKIKWKTQGLVYPPIAKAAHVEGVVTLRVRFDPSGTVKDTESISGPKLLAEPSTNRIKDWRFKTNATGNELCQNLVIIKYRILPENYTAPEPGSEPREPQPTGSYVIRIDAYTIVLTQTMPALRPPDNPSSASEAHPPRRTIKPEDAAMRSISIQEFEKDPKACIAEAEAGQRLNTLPCAAASL